MFDVLQLVLHSLQEIYNTLTEMYKAATGGRWFSGLPPQPPHGDSDSGGMHALALLHSNVLTHSHGHPPSSPGALITALPRFRVLPRCG